LPSMLGAECPFCGGRFVDIRLITVDETGHMLGVPRGTVKRWIREGMLDARVWVRGGRQVIYMIDSYDIDEFKKNYRPRRSELSPDSPNPIARQAYRILRLKHPGAYQKGNRKLTPLQKVLDDDKGM